MNKDIARRGEKVLFIETDFLNEISVPSKLHEYGDILKGYELCCVGLWDFLTRRMSIICTACCASLKEQGISLQKVSLTAIYSNSHK
ncbi:MAG: hypothetical protein E6543_23285 [Enterobacter hormaechei]|nr:hypothetical protein [Enterobacter hormaechei]